MTAVFDADVFRSASHANMIEHVVGPLADGARETIVPLDANDEAAIEFSPRLPTVLLALKQNLDAAPLAIDVVIGANAAVRLEFAPYSEAGSSLCVAVPAVDAASERSSPFRVKVTLVPTDLDIMATLAELVEVRL